MNIMKIMRNIALYLKAQTPIFYNFEPFYFLQEPVVSARIGSLWRDVPDNRTNKEWKQSRYSSCANIIIETNVN